MPRYSYTALSESGERTASTLEAPSLPALAAQLANQGARIETAHEVLDGAPPIRGIPYFEVLGIYRQIASSIEAGMPLSETLRMLSTEARNAQLKALLYYLESEVSGGIPLSDAMKRYPRIFPSVHIAVVRAGEESGKLDTALEELADQAESYFNMSRRFASALVYPTVIAVAALSLLNFAFFFVVPKFVALFTDLGVRDLPLPTQFVVIVSKLIAPITVLIIIGVAMLLTIIMTQRKAASGRLLLDAWKLRLPMIGQIVEKAALARFAGTLGLLLDAGIELPRALNMASEGAGSGIIERILKNVSTEVELGHTLSESIDKHAAMPPTIAWRIGVGEETGTLAESLLKVSKLYSRQVDALVTSLAGLIEPVMIMLIGSSVISLVLGMFLPLVAIIQNLSGG